MNISISLRIGVILLKPVLTVIAFVIAAGLGAQLSKATTGRIYFGASIAYVFQISMIVPVWYSANFGWRIAAASAGIAAGFGTWVISLFVESSDIALSSTMIGFIRAGAIVVSLVACVSILRIGRVRNGREAESAILTRSSPTHLG
jgi:hypothetical protein